MTGMPADADETYQREHCDVCGDDTPHEVSMEIRETHTDAPREENRKFAKSPCRVTTCKACGNRSRTLQR